MYGLWTITYNDRPKKYSPCDNKFSCKEERRFTKCIINIVTEYYITYMIKTLSLYLMLTHENFEMKLYTVLYGNGKKIFLSN